MSRIKKSDRLKMELVLLVMIIAAGYFICRESGVRGVNYFTGLVIIIMARKTAANLNMHRLDLRIWLSVGCKRRFYFFLYLPVFSYFRLWYSVLCDSTYSLIFSIVTPPVVAMK